MLVKLECADDKSKESKELATTLFDTYKRIMTYYTSVYCAYASINGFLIRQV